MQLETDRDAIITRQILTETSCKPHCGPSDTWPGLRGFCTPPKYAQVFCVMRFGRKCEVQVIPSVSRPTNTGVKGQDSKLGIVAYTSGQDFGGLNLSPEEYDSTTARRDASDSKRLLKHGESTPKLVDVPFYGIPIPEIIAFVAGIILVVANPAEDAENNTLGTVLVIGAMLGFILCSPLSFTRVTNFIPDLVYLAIGSAWTLYGALRDGRSQYRWRSARRRNQWGAAQFRVSPH